MTTTRTRGRSFPPRDLNTWHSLIPILWRRKWRGNRTRAKMAYWRRLWRRWHDPTRLTPAEIDYMVKVIANFPATPPIEHQTPIFDMFTARRGDGR